MTTGNTDSAVRVFLMDDHEVIHRGFQGLLASHPDLTLVGAAMTAMDALKQVPAIRPDVAVLDVNLPVGNGIEVCRQLLSTVPGLRCLMITSDSDDDALFAALLGGASGFVTKRASADEMLEVLRRTARHQSRLDPTVVRELLASLEESSVSAPATPPLRLTSAIELTQLNVRQRKILGLVLRGRTNIEIAAHLGVSEAAISRHIAVLFTTLGLRRRLRAASFEADRIP